VLSIPLSIRYDPVEDGWVQARIEELPVITAGPTREDARELVLDALREYLLSLQSPASGGGSRERESVALTISA